MPSTLALIYKGLKNRKFVSIRRSFLFLISFRNVDIVAKYFIESALIICVLVASPMNENDTTSITNNRCGYHTRVSYGIFGRYSRGKNGNKMHEGKKSSANVGRRANSECFGFFFGENQHAIFCEFIVVVYRTTCKSDIRNSICDRHSRDEQN